MQAAPLGRWCEQHQRLECVSPRKKGRGPCHGHHLVSGTDKCRMHLGVKAQDAITEELARQAVITYGLPRDIAPTDALLEEVRYSAGHVAWLRGQVAALEAESLVWGITEEAEKNATEFAGTDKTQAAVMNVWLDLYHKERRYLLDVTKAVIAAGVEERRVKLAEAQGSLLNDVIRRILARLGLSSEQSALLPVVVPEELRRAAAMASAN
jgi:hypothetical protein